MEPDYSHIRLNPSLTGRGANQSEGQAEPRTSGSPLGSRRRRKSWTEVKAKIQLKDQHAVFFTLRRDLWSSCEAHGFIQHSSRTGGSSDSRTFPEDHAGDQSWTRGSHDQGAGAPRCFGHGHMMFFSLFTGRSPSKIASIINHVSVSSPKLNRRCY